MHVAGALLAVQIAGAALLLGAAAAPIPALLRQSILIDDTFYSLAAARHLAAGEGSTVDGIHATNGYQPLWVWILAGLTRLGRLGPDGTVRAALLLCALAALGTGALLVGLVRALGGSEAAAAWAAALWLLNPYLLRRQMNGLETPLAALLVVGVLLAEVRRLSGLKLGVLAGLAGLARVDLLVLAPLLALRRRRLAALTAAAVAAPWVVWSWMRFGSPVPLSGEANRVLYRVLRGLPEGSWIVWDPGNVSWTAASLPGLGWPAAILERLGLPRALTWVVVPAAAAVGWVVASAGEGTRERLRSWWEAVRPLALWGGSIAAYLGAAYALFYPAPWHLNRYFLPLHALWIAAAALFFDRVIAGNAAVRVGRQADSGEGAEAPLRPQPVRQRLWWALWGAGMAAGLVPYLVDTTGGLRPALGLEVARWIREDAPAGARVGVLQSGVAGYYAGRPVVNLDGKVNPGAMRAIRNGTTAQYLRSERIEIFGDWNDLVERCVFGRAGAGEAELRRRAVRIGPGEAGPGVPPSPFAFYRLRQR